MRREKRGGVEVKEEKHTRGAGRYLRVDTDCDCLEFKLPIANDVLTFKHLHRAMFMPQKSKKMTRIQISPRNVF